MAQEDGLEVETLNKATDRSTRIAIIGAGPVGLAVAKALLQDGTPYEQLEADDDLGGNWYHGVYETAHLISSKRTTEYPDFPMPDDYPDFPSARQMFNYLRSYAEAFNLRPQIQFRSKVLMCLPLQDGRWELQLDGGEKRVYKGVIVCNGHHWDRRYPDYPGTFAGEYIHSKDYKHPRQLVGKRVLVVGGGNSACDIASEAARVAQTCDLSLRRGYWFLPKTTFGIPLAELAPGWTPVWTQRLFLKILVRFTFGRYENYGLPKPNHRIFEAHPTVNSDLLSYIKHGRIRPRGEVNRFEAQRVIFADGTSDEFDTVVCATGFHLSFPFLPPGLVPVRANNALLYGGSALLDFKNIYLVGTAQPRYGFGPLMTPAADLISRLILIQDEMELPIGLMLKEVGVQPLRTHLLNPHEAVRQMTKIKQVLPQLPRKERKLRQRLKQKRSLLPRREIEYERPNPNLRVF
jgi:cation diffusion facilitator CzcD-associated flavoprotein CzcO